MRGVRGAWGVRGVSFADVVKNAPKEESDSDDCGKDVNASSAQTMQILKRKTTSGNYVQSNSTHKSDMVDITPDSRKNSWSNWDDDSMDTEETNESNDHDDFLASPSVSQSVSQKPASDYDLFFGGTNRAHSGVYGNEYDHEYNEYGEYDAYEEY